MKAEFARFLVAGGTATAITYVVYAGLIFAGSNAYVAMALAYTTGYFVNFYLGRAWVFRAGRMVGTLRAELMATATVTVFGLAINLGTIAILTNPPLAINDYLAGALAIGLATIWNYAARKKWVYQ